MKKISTLHAEWMKDEEYCREYHALAAEFVHWIEVAKKNDLKPKNG